MDSVDHGRIGSRDNCSEITLWAAGKAQIMIGVMAGCLAGLAGMALMVIGWALYRMIRAIRAERRERDKDPEKYDWW